MWYEEHVPEFSIGLYYEKPFCLLTVINNTSKLTTVDGSWVDLSYSLFNVEVYNEIVDELRKDALKRMLTYED